MPDVTAPGFVTVAVSVTTVSSATLLEGLTASVVVVGVAANAGSMRKEAQKGKARTKEVFFKKGTHGLLLSSWYHHKMLLCPLWSHSIQKS